jgi:hypothetical protein
MQWNLLNKKKGYKIIISKYYITVLFEIQLQQHNFEVKELEFKQNCIKNLCYTLIL